MNDVALDDARETRTLFSAAARNVLVTLVGQAVSVGLSLLTTLWLIQHLGPARYGIYLVVLTIITLLDLTIEASLFEMAVREIAKSKDRAPEWLGAVTWIRATSGALLSAALLLGPLVLPLHPEASAAVWVGAGICLVNGFRTPLTYFRARLLMHWEFGLWTLVRALELGLVILITRHEGSLALLLGAKAVTAVLFVAAVWSVLHYRFRLPVHSGRSLVRPLLLLSAPVTLTLLLMMVQLRGDILMMSWRL